jgi:hypothetical protein
MELEPIEELHGMTIVSNKTTAVIFGKETKKIGNKIHFSRVIASLREAMLSR